MSGSTYLALARATYATYVAKDRADLVPDGNRVFVTYEAREVDGRRFRNTAL